MSRENWLCSSVENEKRTQSHPFEQSPHTSLIARLMKEYQLVVREAVKRGDDRFSTDV